MIQQKTILKVADNSGARTVRCIKIFGFKKKVAQIGDIILISVQTLRNISKKTSKVKNKEIYQALIIRTKLGYKKKNNFHSFFQENSVVLINKQKAPIGTRIIGPIPKVLRKKKFQKFVSISNGLI